MMDKWMAKSLEYERAYSDALQKAHNAAVIGMYGMEAKYRRDALTFREKSDEMFRLHKQHTEVFDSAVAELAIAIVKQATRDYEAAICDRDEKAQHELELFLSPTLVHKVQRDKKGFAQKAHEDYDGILAMTVYLRKIRRGKDVEDNPFRCPNCGGGMFVKAKAVHGKRIVGCTGCGLRETIDRGGRKPDAS